MSNLLKSKILVGVFAFALMFAGFVAVNTANAATCDMGATTLRQGSKGEAVKCLQQTLNAKGFTVATTGAGSMGMETTTFGPATANAVRSFQASAGLKADAVVGAMTKGALNAAMPTPTNLPAGCSSTAGFSTTTGQPCSTTTTFPAGCTSAVGFSPVTGAKCDSTTTTPTPTPSTTNFTVSVNGTQGDIDDINSGTPDKTEALEGQSSVEVWAADIETEKNGPLMVQTLNVWFGNSDTTSSYKPWDYFTSVDLMVDGKKVASMDVDSSSDWTKNESNTPYLTSVSSTNQYRLRFNGLNSVLPSGDTTTVSVAVSVANTIDTADQSAVWEVDFGDLRVMDETGFVNDIDGQTYGVQDNFTMGGADVAKLDLSDSTSNPDATVLKVSETDDTEGVTVYAFEIEEENDVDATIEEMTFNFVTSATSTNSVYARAFLYQGSNLVGTETVGGSTSNTTVTFDNMNISLNGDATSQFTVKVDLKDNDSGSRYPEGTTITVSATAITAAEDVNGNDEGDMTLSYSGTSETHELRSEGINVVRVGTPTATKTTSTDTATTADSVEFVVKFNVTAFGADMYVDKSSEDDNGTDAAGQGVVFDILKNGTSVNATGSTYSTASAILEAAGSTTNDGTHVFRVDQNATREFTLRVSFPLSVSPTGTDSDGFYQMVVNSINWGTANANTNANYYTFNLDDFKTPNIALSDYSI